MLRGETVTFLVPDTSKDPYSGVDIPDWSKPPSEVDVKNVLCEPRPTGEPKMDARNQVTSGFTLYCLDGVDPLPSPHHRVRIRGITYEVDGEPAEWIKGSYRPGVVVQTKKVEG